MLSPLLSSAIHILTHNGVAWVSAPGVYCGNEPETGWWWVHYTMRHTLEPTGGGNFVVRPPSPQRYLHVVHTYADVPYPEWAVQGTWVESLLDRERWLVRHVSPEAITLGDDFGRRRVLGRYVGADWCADEYRVCPTEVWSAREPEAKPAPTVYDLLSTFGVQEKP